MENTPVFKHHCCGVVLFVTGDANRIKVKYAALDIESTGLKPYGGTIWMVSICYGDLKPKIWHDCNGMRKCPSEVKALLENKTICKVIHNGEFDLPYMELVWGIRGVNIWDTMVCEKVIQGVTMSDDNSKKITEEYRIAHSAALKYTLQRYGLPVPDKSVRENFINRRPGIPFSNDELNYAKADVYPLLPLQRAQERILTRDSLLEVALLDNKMVEKIARMRVVGIGCDKWKWLEVADSNLNEYKRAITMLPRSVENWGSEKQVKYYFKHRFNITIDSYKNLKTIYIKTRNHTLGLFIKTRQMYSDATLYGKTWLYREDGSSTIDGDGRIRPSYDQNKNTGRLATSDPNVLGLPRKGLQRSCIVPRKGNVFVIGDFDGQEIAIMAAASGEDFWINALLRHEDIHGLMAFMLQRSSWEQGTEKGCAFPKKCKCPEHKAIRIPAKESNFLLAYGGGYLKLLERIVKGMFEKGIPTTEAMENLMTDFEARVFVRKHKNALKKLVPYLERNAKDALLTQVSYSADPYRRRRVLKGEQDWEIRNQGMNNPIQSAAANMIKLAIVSMPWKYNIILPFHDEIVVECPKTIAKECSKVMAKIMEDSADYITGIKGLVKADVRIQSDYAKELTESNKVFK